MGSTRQRVREDVKEAVDLFEKCRSFTTARELQAAGIYPYFQPIERSSDTEVVIGGERKIMVGSNNYLGLTHHPHVLERAEAALERYGSGCTGSPFLNGTLDMHKELESRLAALMGQEAALVFSTGYQTNLGVISTLVGRGDVVVQDKLNHASLVDGGLLAFGGFERYGHMDYDALRRILERHRGEAGLLVVTDGIFSMEGDIVDLPALVEVTREFGASLMVDDAHAAGVLGDDGGGTARHFGLADEVDLVMATFSKSFASIGGVIAGSEDVIHYLRHQARPLIFSASMPPSAVATVLGALDVMEREPERRKRLWENADYLREGFVDLGFDVTGSETPIIPVATGEMERTFTFWKALFDAGIFTNPVTPPAVPEHSCRLRTSVIATHTRDQLDQVLECFDRIGGEHGIV